MATGKVYAAISKVAAELAKEGISKNRRNEQQGYKFRGIDDVYNALAGSLSSAGLCIIPHYSERIVCERTNAKGTALFYVTVAGTFDIVCAEDGSTHVAGPFYGEAMDSGDKATNKAMSAAYKYMAMQTFAIPTEGDNDADATTHEVKPASIAVDPVEVDISLKSCQEAAMQGRKALVAAWKKLPDAVKGALSHRMAELGKVADAADAQPQTEKV